MSPNITPILAVVGLLLFSGGCTTTGSTTADPSTARDVAEMKERILELQEQAAVTEVELDRLREEIAALQSRLTDGAPATASASVIEETRPSMAPPESVEVPNTAEVLVEESDLGTESDPPATAVAAPAPAAEVASPQPGSSAGPSGPLQPVEPAAQALYDRGYTLYHQGKYLDAEASFQRFLQAYPNTELSDNALFWIGEARYARNDVQGAMAAFREVVQKYPQGNKVPDALIKEGDCLDRLGDKDGARDRFEEVGRRFPDTGAAVMAADRLEKLDG